MTILNKQILYFVVTGSLAALTHFVVLWLSVELMLISPAWGNVLGFLSGFFVSFLGHYHVTFAHSQTTIGKSLKRWLLSSVLAFLANQLLFIIGLRLLTEHYYALIWLVVTIMVTVGSFLSGKLWAFKSTTND